MPIPIISKTITRLLKEDIIRAARTLQTCARLESGIETVIHSEGKVSKITTMNACCLFDAGNAFNKFKKKISLKNIKRLCPTQQLQHSCCCDQKA